MIFSHSIRRALAQLVPTVGGFRGSNRLTIMTYHRVFAQPDALIPEPSADTFSWHMELISRYCTPLSMRDALSHLKAGTLPERAVCVTFDDGYANNIEVALPILQHYDVPATVFVATDYLQGGMMWNDLVYETVRRLPSGEVDLGELGVQQVEENQKSDLCDRLIRAVKHLPQEKRKSAVESAAERVSGIPEHPMMTPEQVRTLHQAGIEIGAHTLSHPILATLDEPAALEEIRGSKQLLERLIQSPLRYFAYPNGRLGDDYLLCHRDMVKQEGFEAAFSTQWGCATTESDHWQLPRFTPWDNSPERFLLRLLLNYRNPA